MRARSTTVLRNIINATVFPLHRTGKLEEELSDMYDLSKVSESVEASLKSSRRRMFRRWRGFADGLRTQWHMISFVAAVFIGTLATMLQDPFVSKSPLALATAAVSLLCALSSLLYGVILHVHLSKIKSWEATIMWLKNMQHLQTQSLVNPVKLLVSPLAWLLCSAAFFILALFLAYVWAPDLGETNVRRHPVLRAAVACVFLAWAVQGPVAFWTLRQLRRRPPPDTLA